jgi:hypothetical protein
MALALTFDCVSVADGRQPAGFASFTGHSPDGLRRSANKVSAISAIGLMLETGSSFRCFHSTSIEPETLLAEPRPWKSASAQAQYATCKWKGLKTFRTSALTL